MKIYIAAPYPCREEAVDVMRWLESQGHTVTSRWLTDSEDISDTSANQDLEDIRDAHLLLALNSAGWESLGSGGRHVELGYALALGKSIVLVGFRSNIFHYLHQIRVIRSVDEL